MSGIMTSNVYCDLATLLHDDVLLHHSSLHTDELVGEARVRKDVSYVEFTHNALFYSFLFKHSGLLMRESRHRLQAAGYTNSDERNIYTTMNSADVQECIRVDRRILEVRFGLNQSPCEALTACKGLLERLARAGR